MKAGIEKDIEISQLKFIMSVIDLFFFYIDQFIEYIEVFKIHLFLNSFNH